MNAKAFRNWIFTLHRTFGLVVGLVAIVIGLTGSLLIFHSEIQKYDEHLQSGSITPQGSSSWGLSCGGIANAKTFS